MLNKALRLLRTYHQFTQVELATRLEISNTYLSEIETGDKQASIDLLQRYSEVFKMPMSSILIFAETVEAGPKPSTKLRVGAASKILKLLDWIAEKEIVTKDAR